MTFGFHNVLFSDGTSRRLRVYGISGMPRFPSGDPTTHVMVDDVVVPVIRNGDGFTEYRPDISPRPQSPRDGDSRNRDFEQIFVGDRQIEVTHFFSIGETPSGLEAFAYGYWTHDGFFSQGVVHWDGDQFLRQPSDHKAYVTINDRELSQRR